MISYKKIISLTFLITVMISCKKQDLPAKPQSSPFTVTLQGAATIPNDGAKVVVDIKAGSDGWWIVIPTEAKWCTSSQLFGSGDKSITLNFSKNTSLTSRSVTIGFNPT